MKKLVFSLFIIACNFVVFSQTLTQTVKGNVKDKATQEELIGATIELLASTPLQGTITDSSGKFVLENVLIGRQSFKISMLGYKPYFVRELMVSSGKEIVLDIALEQLDITLEEVIVNNKSPKNKAINSMATLSSRQFTIEETQKYAGGMDDPSRLVSSFAGVASPSVNNNGISVRGNSPLGLLWRIEGVEVPSPNHFADLIIAGSGLLSVLNSQMLGNSDFFTGAFPAEYGNATSGVFDINLRTGNDTKREYTLGASLLGLDFATEGPFKKGKQASYLLNYRYSTLGLISFLFPNDEYITYQDLSFKINIPIQKLGKFSIWGIGAYDGIKTKALDKKEWKDVEDRESGTTYLNLFATSINHKLSVSSKSFLNSSLSFSSYGLSHTVRLLDDKMSKTLKSKASKYDYKLTFQSALKTYFSNKHINKTGIYVNNLVYNFNLSDRNTQNSYLQEIVNERGSSILFQFYTQSKFQLKGKIEKPTIILLKIKNTRDSKWFWLENNKINFIAEKGNFIDSKITGSSTQKELDLLEEKTKPIDKERTRLGQILSDRTLGNAYRDSILIVFNNGIEKEVEINKEFIKKNPNSLISTRRLNIFKVRWGKEETAKLFSLMNKDRQQSEYGKSINRFIELNKNPQIGDKYVDFEQTNTKNQKIKLSDKIGKYTLIEFWASWCTPCRQENPNLMRTYKKYNPMGFEIFAVSLDDKKESWLKSIEKDGLTWENVSDLKGRENDAGKIYGVDAIPDNILIDENGIIIGRNLRGKNLENKLEELVKASL